MAHVSRRVYKSKGDRPLVAWASGPQRRRSRRRFVGTMNGRRPEIAAADADVRATRRQHYETNVRKTPAHQTPAPQGEASDGDTAKKVPYTTSVVMGVPAILTTASTGIYLPRRHVWLAILLCALVFSWTPPSLAQVGASAGQGASEVSAEQRAIDYLAREVPRWSRENHCFSCHNNGDAARALYVGRSLGYRLPGEALADTTAWLLRPQGWDDNKGDPGFSDKKLARIQFAAALAQAVETEAVSERQPLLAVAEALLGEQQEDGSWSVDASGTLGSPATYGITLATYAVRQTLVTADAARFADAIARADAWFLTQRPRTTVDAAALTLALTSRQRTEQHTAPIGDAVVSKLRETLDRILQSQASDGGWGPYPKSPSEAFDTAIALLALANTGEMTAGDTTIPARKIAEGRSYLMRTQLPEGGWTETTRPSGNQSYAQHISTSGWATLALLKTLHFSEIPRQ